MTAIPYKQSQKSKKGQVEEMFNNISPKYDFLNHLFSANIDKIWRKRTINLLRKHHPLDLLDIATGTGDFAIAASKIEGSRIIGVDISAGMLEVAKKKVFKKGLSSNISFQKADSENLPFENEKFDAAIVGFGVRNFENLHRGLNEIYRVLKPGGVCYVLEFSMPEKTPFKQIYNFYFMHILPLIGRLISKDKSAYTYLHESVSEFPYGEKFLTILANVGFVDNRCFPQTFGIASVYEAIKKESEQRYNKSTK